MSCRAIVWFCALSLAVSWGLQGLLLATFGLRSPQAMWFLLAVMWSPTAVALGFLVFSRQARRVVRWGPGKLHFLPMGILVQTLVGLALVFAFLLLGWGAPESFRFSPEGVSIAKGPWLLGKGLQSWLLFGANVAITAVVFSVFNLIGALGEEFAWRGFLQSQLVDRFGVGRGIVILGLFWSAWHLPMLLAGYNYPEHPLLGAFVLFPIQLVAASFFFGWLTIRSGSFWPAALAHAATNSIQQGLISDMKLVVSDLYADVFRVGATVVVGLACWWALTRARARVS